MSNAVYPIAVRGLTYPILKSGYFNTIPSSAPSGVSVRVAQSNNPMWRWELTYDYLKNDPADIVAALTPYTDYDYLRGFVLSKLGSYDDFLFPDPVDYIVAAQSLPFLSDGLGAWYSPIRRTIGGQFTEDITDLNPLNGSGLTLLVNGGTAPPRTLLGPGLALPTYSFLGMYLKWTGWVTGTYAANALIVDPAGHIQKVTAGGGGASGGTIPTFNDAGGTTTDGALTWTDQGLITTVVAGFSFYFRVHFDDDNQDIEQFTNLMYTIGGNGGKGGKGMITLVTARPALA